MNTTPKLYKLDSRGRVREWWGEYRTEPTPAWRVHSGLQDGKKAVSGWKEVTAKNVGKKNEVTAEEQAKREAFAKFERQKDGQYCEDLSTFVPPPKPMLAQTYKNQDVAGWLVQSKLDGFRCLYRNGKLYTRTGKEHGPALEHIRKALESEMSGPLEDVVLDGEIYIHDSEGCNFNELSGIIRKKNLTDEDREKASQLKFYMYDLYDPREPDMEFYRRHSLLSQIWSVLPNFCDMVFCEKGDPQELHDKYVKEGYEGAVLRDPESPYEHKRSKYLLKYKDFQDEELPVLRVEAGAGNWSGMAKRVTVSYKGKEVGCGIRGTQEEMREFIQKALDGVLPKEVTVRHFGETTDGSLRFPICTHIWWSGRDL